MDLSHLSISGVRLEHLIVLAVLIVIAYHVLRFAGNLIALAFLLIVVFCMWAYEKLSIWMNRGLRHARRCAGLEWCRGCGNYSRREDTRVVDGLVLCVVCRTKKRV